MIARIYGIEFIFYYYFLCTTQYLCKWTHLYFIQFVLSICISSQLFRQNFILNLKQASYIYNIAVCLQNVLTHRVRMAFCWFFPGRQYNLEYCYSKLFLLVELIFPYWLCGALVPTYEIQVFCWTINCSTKLHPLR